MNSRGLEYENEVEIIDSFIDKVIHSGRYDSRALTLQILSVLRGVNEYFIYFFYHFKRVRNHSLWLFNLDKNHITKLHFLFLPNITFNHDVSGIEDPNTNCDIPKNRTFDD